MYQGEMHLPTRIQRRGLRHASVSPQGQGDLRTPLRQRPRPLPQRALRVPQRVAGGDMPPPPTQGRTQAQARHRRQGCPGKASFFFSRRSSLRVQNGSAWTDPCSQKDEGLSPWERRQAMFRGRNLQRGDLYVLPRSIRASLRLLRAPLARHGIGVSTRLPGTCPVLRRPAPVLRV